MGACHPCAEVRCVAGLHFRLRAHRASILQRLFVTGRPRGHTRTGYPSWTGKSQVMSGEDLWDLVEGLKANALIKHSHLLTGKRPPPKPEPSRHGGGSAARWRTTRAVR
jgi:hypothetical protein